MQQKRMNKKRREKKGRKRKENEERREMSIYNLCRFYLLDSMQVGIFFGTD